VELSMCYIWLGCTGFGTVSKGTMSKGIESKD